MKNTIDAKEMILTNFLELDTSQEYQKHIGKVSDIYDELALVLDEEHKKLLQEFESSLTDLYDVQEKELIDYVIKFIFSLYI